MSNDNLNDDEQNISEHIELHTLEQKFIKKTELDDLLKKRNHNSMTTILYLLLIILIVIPFYFTYIEKKNKETQSFDQTNQTMKYFTSNENSMKKTINNFTTKVNSMDQTINDFTTKVNSMDQTINDFTTKVNSMDQTINKLTETMNMMNQAFDSMTQTIHYLTTTMNSMNQSLINSNNKVNSLNNELYFIKGKVNSMNQTIDFIKKNINCNNDDLKAQPKIDILNDKLDSIQQKIKSVSDLTNQNIENLNNVIFAGRSLTGPGILNELKKQEKDPFDRLFIPSISSRNLYDMIDPKSEGFFGSCDDSSKKFFIEVSLKKPIQIKGLKIFSSIKRFPKSFDIEVDNKIVVSVKEARELNGKNREMIIDMQPIIASKIRIIQTGPNWDENNYFIYIKKIELLSPDFPNGVFESVIKNSNPQKNGILMKSSLFDLNSFHLLNSTNNVDSFNNKNQWFQIEFPKGKVVIDGFRLKKFGRHKLKNYKIVCSNDESLPISEWTQLIEINEQKYHENKDFDVYEFEKASPPVKFVRLVQTGPTWSNSNYLSFYHFDLFGKYY